MARGPAGGAGDPVSGLTSSTAGGVGGRSVTPAGGAEPERSSLTLPAGPLARASSNLRRSSFGSDDETATDGGVGAADSVVSMTGGAGDAAADSGLLEVVGVACAGVLGLRPFPLVVGGASLAPLG